MCSTLDDNVPKYKRRCQISSEMFSNIQNDFRQLEQLMKLTFGLPWDMLNLAMDMPASMSRIMEGTSFDAGL